MYVRFPVSDIQARNQKLSDFGLEQPNLIVRVEYADEISEYCFGAPVEINNQLYMLGPSKDEILVVKANLIQPFLVDLEQLRSHSLFAIPVFEIRSLLVEFNDDNSRRRFTHDENSWVIDSPFLADANDERVQGAIDRLVNYEVDLTKPAGSGENSLDVTHFNAIARFEIIGNRRNSTLLVSQYMMNGEVDTNLYRGRFEGSETTFLIPRSEIDWWRTSQSSLRERRFMHVNPLKVSKVEVVQTGETPAILRLLKLENSQWRIYSGETTAELVDYQGDAAIIAETLTQLNDLIILTFANDNPTPGELEQYGLSQPRLVITLESEETTKLWVGNRSADGKQVYLKLEGSDSVYLVSDEIITGLTLNPLDYRNRVIPLVNSDQVVTGFRITDIRDGHITDGTDVETLMRTAIQPLSREEAEAIHAAANTLFKDFRADSFFEADVTDGALHFGVVEIALPFRLEILHGTREVSPSKLLLSKRLSGSEQVAWVQDRQLALKLRQELVDVIYPLIYVTQTPEEWAPAQPSIEEEEELESPEPVPDASTSTVETTAATSEASESVGPNPEGDE